MLFSKIFSKNSGPKLINDFDSLDNKHKQFLIFSHILTRLRIEGRLLFTNFKAKYGIPIKSKDGKKIKIDEQKLINLMRVSVSETTIEMFKSEIDNLEKFTKDDKITLKKQLSARYKEKKTRTDVPSKTVSPYPSMFALLEVIKQNSIPVILEIYRYMDQTLKKGSLLANIETAALLYKSSADGFSFDKVILEFDSNYKSAFSIQLFSIFSDKSSTSQSSKYHKLSILKNFDDFIKELTKMDPGELALNLVVNLAGTQGKRSAKVERQKESIGFVNSYNKLIKDSADLHTQPNFLLQYPVSLGTAIAIEGRHAMYTCTASTISRQKLINYIVTGVRK